MMRISHSSTHGALLSVTFLGRQVPGGDLCAQQEQWQAIKQAAMETTLANGGTLSHQYGVGREYVSWIERERGDVGFKITQAVKQSLDPYNIMNPGVVLPA
jgi:alkyldihydroxyacetonephosphate synthase